MFKRLITPPGFVTFVIYRHHKYSYFKTNIHPEVFGFNIRDCDGPTILDGLKLIERKMEPTMFSLCDDNNGMCECILCINGKRRKACQTIMLKNNIIVFDEISNINALYG